MTLPPTVNLVFRCRYVSGIASISDESLDTGWFAPDEALGMISHPYFRKAFKDALGYCGQLHFAAFRRKDQAVIFESDTEL